MPTTILDKMMDALSEIAEKRSQSATQSEKWYPSATALHDAALEVKKVCPTCDPGDPGDPPPPPPGF